MCAGRSFPIFPSLVTVTSAQHPTPVVQACRKGGSEEGVEPARVAVLQIARGEDTEEQIGDGSEDRVGVPGGAQMERG